MEKIKLDTTVSLSSVEKRRNVVGTSTVTKTNKFWRTEKAKERQQCSTNLVFDVLVNNEEKKKSNLFTLLISGESQARPAL